VRLLVTRSPWAGFPPAHGTSSRRAPMSPLDRLLQVARWRWTPLVVPTLGTSVFVSVIAWLIPDDFGSAGPRTTRPAVAGLDLHASNDDAHEADDTTPSAAPVSTHLSTQPTSHQPSRRRGFSPPLERPSEPPPPPMPPPPPPGGPAIETPPPPQPPVPEGPNSDRWREGQQSASNAATRASARAGSLAARIHARNQTQAEAAQVEAPPQDAAAPEPAPSLNDTPDAPPAPQ
jgi:hypothetical protein